MLNDIFSRFDSIVDKYAVENQDHWRCLHGCSGITIANDNHLSNLLRMSMEMLTVLINTTPKTICAAHDRYSIASNCRWIGQKKISYDVWGNTVNVASRMESTGIPGRVQVTEDVAKTMDVEFNFEKRGSVEIKGKGVMTTYFLVA